jgi:hypothetical protein
MSRVHFRSLHGFDNEVGSVSRTEAALGGSDEPVVVIGGHEHQLPPPVSGDLDRFTLRLVLELAEPALKFQGGCLCHFHLS